MPPSHLENNGQAAKRIAYSGATEWPLSDLMQSSIVLESEGDFCGHLSGTGETIESHQNGENCFFTF